MAEIETFSLNENDLTAGSRSSVISSRLAQKMLSVLHLSDLHISGTVLPDRFNSLLDDIRTQVRELSEIVLVVSGDIVCQGEVDRSRFAVLEFFNKVNDIVGNKLLDVEIVPGNHDITRDYLFGTDSYDIALQGYFALRSSILALFGRTEDQKPAYGTSVVNCGGRSVCFVRVDTSWYFEGQQCERFLREKFAKECLSPEDVDQRMRMIWACKKARISEYIKRQSHDLVDDINRRKKQAKDSGAPIELIVAIAHHPLSWLMRSTRESYVDFLRRYGIPDLDIWMCGHAHDVKIHYDNDDNQATIVLMSGVGGEELRRAIHRYSIYHLSFVRNVCAISVRASRADGTFKPDESLTPTETSGRTTHFCYPLKARTPGAVIELHTCDKNPSMEFYADQRALGLVQDLAGRMIDLGLKLTTTERVQRKIFANQKLKDTRAERFSIFLSRVCDDVVTMLMMKSRVYKGFPRYLRDDDPEIQWRVHFRVMKRSGKREVFYRCIACSGVSIPLLGDEAVNRMRDVPWDSLICRAYKDSYKTLVRSVNEYDDVTKTKWDDFLTSIIEVDGNVAKIKSEERPIITFGISAKTECYEDSVVASRLLYLLEFFNVNRIVSLCVQEYMRNTKFNLQELVK